MASSRNRILKLSTFRPYSFSQLVCQFSSRRETDFSPNFNSNREENNGRKVQDIRHPIPNRSLRGESGEKRLNRSRSQSQSQSSPPARGPRDVKNETDEAFLDKFKLRLDSNKDNETPLPNRRPNKQHMDADSPPPEADEIFRKMKETGLIPNAVAMLDGLCKDGLVQEAMKLFGLMREKGTIPEVVVYTAVVDGYVKARKLDDAKRIFRKMLVNGISPNAFSYGVLIQGLCKSNLVDDAIDFTFQMLEAGHSPNIATFVGLVDEICKDKGIEEAQSVIGSWKKKGFFVNDKAVREFLDKNAPLSSSAWEAILGKKPSL